MKYYGRRLMKKKRSMKSDFYLKEETQEILEKA